MPMAGGADSLLRDEAWRSERVINVFRSAIWIIACTAILSGSAFRDEPLYPGVAFGLIYGIAMAIVGATWLKRSYHVLVPYVVSALDVVVLAIIADRTHQIMLIQVPAEAQQQLHDVISAVMLLLGVNALRFSWRVTAWSTAWSVAAVVGLLVKNLPSTGPVNLIVNIVQIVGLGAILGYSARKLHVVIHRVKERDAFARFLPEPVVEELTRDPTAMNLGGKKQESTVLFADIRGFTTMAEALEPEDVVALLNEYFAEMVDEIFDNEGILDKFIGDGIVAVFGPPLAAADQAKRAVRCARGMLRRLRTINEARQARGSEPLRIGIGIHSGMLVAGKIGSPRRLEYTHIGDTVNTASRIVGMTKELGCAVLISATTRAQLPDDESVESLGAHEIRGRRSLDLFALT
jgi:adenylate cyclase